MSDERFSPEQAQYLASLPAVISITGHVSDMQSGSSVNAFRVLKMGESPTVLFREAGLGPELMAKSVLNGCMHSFGGRQYE